MTRLVCFCAVAMKIASFNIQRFGKNKVADPKILNVLIKVTHTLKYEPIVFYIWMFETLFVS